MRWEAMIVGSILVAAISIAAIPLLTSPAPHAQAPAARSAWPHNEGRLFDVPSKQAWDRVQDRLKDLGLHADKEDGENQLLLTEWGDFHRLRWLSKPKMPQEYAPERVRFEVFVSPYVEPARLYVGSVSQVRQVTGRGLQAILYNDPTVNAALVAELAKALGHEGFGIPSSREERQKLVASVRKGRPDECALQVDVCKVSPGKVEKPQMLPLSQFQVLFPESAARERVEAPVVVQLYVSEDGAVVGGKLIGSPRGTSLRPRRPGPRPPGLLTPPLVRLPRPAHDRLHDQLPPAIAEPVRGTMIRSCRREILGGGRVSVGVVTLPVTACHPHCDPVVQRPSTPPFQGGERGFESRQGRQSPPSSSTRRASLTRQLHQIHLAG
jgi:hypothetical protein